MLEGQRSREDGARSGARHEDFLELCALAAAGNLSEPEQNRLQEHLATCSECRQAMTEFESVVDHVIPELVPDHSEELPADSSFSLDQAEAAFRKRLCDEKERKQSELEGDAWLSPLVVRRSRSFRRHFDRYDLWLPMAASLLLCVTLGILSYKTGMSRGFESARLEGQYKAPVQTARGDAPGITSTNTEMRDDELAARDAVLADLRREIAQKTNELEKARTLAASEQVALETSAEDKKGIAGERDRLLEQVSAGEARLRETQERLKKLERERTDYAIHTASLETKIADLSASLEGRERLTTEQQDLLAKDRDIRELIGARDLYITEIYDVARNGDTRKAAGRVFYTKGKSLVFYAYDLNESPGVKDASTFEAWGQRGSDWRQASKLGIFYEDNAAKKRWVVKSNDKKTLDQLDAVFITVEPNGGSERPTGKPLLFAYLKVAPNHP